MFQVSWRENLRENDATILSQRPILCGWQAIGISANCACVAINLISASCKTTIFKIRSNHILRERKSESKIHESKSRERGILLTKQDSTFCTSSLTSFTIFVVSNFIQMKISRMKCKRMSSVKDAKKSAERFPLSTDRVFIHGSPA